MAIEPVARPRNRATRFFLHLFGLGLVAVSIGFAAIGGLRGSLAQAATTVTVQVGQKPDLSSGNRYNPASVTINLGDTVSFIRFAGTHDVISGVVPGGAGTFVSSSPMVAGVPFLFTPTAAGTYTYYCQIHADPDVATLANIDANIAAGEMVGKIVVTSAAATVTATATIATPIPTTTAPAATPGTTTPTAAASPSPSATPSATATVTATSGAPATVLIIDYAYSPSTISVAPGTAVKWVNTGAKKHTVTATDLSYDSGLLAAGAEWSRTFSTAGTYDYFCDLHPEMVGQVTVGTGGSGGTPPPTSTAAPSGTPASTPTPPAVSSSPGDIQVVDYAYSPASASVAVGTSVRWVNAGAKKHTVTAADSSFDSGLMVTGDVYIRTFTTEGSYEYYCDLHPDMIGTVVVGAGGGAGTSPATSTPIASPPPPAAPGSVQIVDYDYSPKDLSVPVGASVRFVNVGAKKHTVTAADGSFDSGLMVTGDAYSRTFSSVGNYQYFCDLHPDMAGSVTVTDSPGGVGPWPPIPGVPSNLLYNEVWNRATGKYSSVLVSSATEITSGNAALWGVILQGVRDGTITAADLPPNLIAFVEAQYGRLGGPPTSFHAKTPVPTPTPPAKVAPTSSAGGAGPAGGVQIIDFDYNPRTIAVRPGTVLRFINSGVAKHTVTAFDGSFDSGFMAKGDAYSRTFSTPGTYDYFCVLHPDMAGTVQVQDEAGTIPPAVAVPAPPPPPAAAPGDVQVLDFDYGPRSISVAAGATVRFANVGIAPHTVTSRDGSFDSGILSRGDSYRHTFAAPGTYEYFCILHPAMTGAVRVTDATGVAPPPALRTDAGISPATFPAASLPAEAKSASVTMIDFDFQTRTINVKPGTEVGWQNAGIAPHTVTARDGSFDSGLVLRGGSFAYRFESVGSFAYYCTLHPNMEGTVVVAESAPTVAAGPRVTLPPVNTQSGPSDEAAKNILVAVWAVVVLVFLVAFPTVIFGIRSSRT